LTGYVPSWASVIYGVLGAGFANYGTKVKFLLRIDDALDIFAVHGIGGLVGNILTAFFASKSIAHLDGVTSIKGGWLDHNWIQLGYQVADSVSGGCYSFAGTTLVLFLLNRIPGMHLRATEEAEVLGIDDAEIGEFAYDYVELTRDVMNDAEGGEAGSMFSGTHGERMELQSRVGFNTHVLAGGTGREKKEWHDEIPLAERVYSGHAVP
jgi:Amt family ammonium transporter